MAQPQAVITNIGQARARIDGPLKVTGTARFTSDHNLPGMLYAVPIGATIGKGKVTAIDTSRARQMPGVRAIFKRGDLPIKRITPNFGEGLMVDETRPPFDDDIVRYYGQYVALAVADTFEQAKAAADAVAVTYAAEAPNVDLHLAAKDTKVVSKRGNAEKAYAGAPVTIDAHYAIAPETHNPIETHATVAAWDGDKLTLYETSQGVVNHRNVLADMLGLPRHKVQVIAKFIGSGFRRQAVAMGAIAARRGGGDQARPTGKAGLEPADDVSRRRPSARHRAAHPPWRQPRRQARVVAARLREYDVDPRQLRRKLRRGDAAHVQRGKSAGHFRACQAQYRHADLDARPGRGARDCSRPSPRWTNWRSSSASIRSNCI